jgi:hypothetical protein
MPSILVPVLLGREPMVDGECGRVLIEHQPKPFIELELCFVDGWIASLNIKNSSTKSSVGLSRLVRQTVKTLSTGACFTSPSGSTGEISQSQGV